MQAGRIEALLLLLAALLMPAAALAQDGTYQISLPDGITGSFASVQGLPASSSSIPLRGSSIRMPGIAKYGNVTLMQGSFPAGNQFWRWVDAIRMNTIERATIIISSGSSQWVLKNAWPTKIGGVSQQGGMVRVEVLEIAHEQLVVRPQ